MSEKEKRLSAPARLLIRAILNILLVAALAAYLPQYVAVGGGVFAIVVIGALLTLLNVLVRPVLALITLPLKVVAGLLALIIVNGVFVWLIYAITSQMDSAIVTLRVSGIAGWILASIVFGLGNWLMKMSLK